MGYTKKETGNQNCDLQDQIHQAAAERVKRVGVIDDYHVDHQDDCCMRADLEKSVVN